MTQHPYSELRVLATLAIQGAMPALAAAFEHRSGTQLAITFAPTNALLADINAGAAVDVAILTQEAARGLAKAACYKRAG